MLYILSLIIGFIVILGIDYFKYDNYTNSAPFYTFILVRVLEFIVPSIIVFVSGTFCKKKI